MELKLVYRVLRQISEWSVQGFYSEVCVTGKENVEPDGPLIITPTHHNEIIDIAALAVTVPHRRHLSFWAKSSMFANPLVGAILSSSGAIPVRRNPNSSTSSFSPDSGAGTSSTRVTSPQSDLFRETSKALAAGKVIVVFPEGTSYTQPSIMQVLPGAAWAAVEYTRWAHARKKEGKQEKPIRIVPVSIVYTDKSRYLSRVIVRYGTPILIDQYTASIFEEGLDVDTALRVAVKEITAKVKQQLTEMTVNAPDWDTLYSSQMARDMLWSDPAKVPLKDWVDISQGLVNVFAPSATVENPLLDSVKASLIKYYALLQHTGIQHAILDPLLSLQPLSQRSIVLRTVLCFPKAILSFLFFAPAMLPHLPAYITGSLAGKYLATEGEEEARSQYKSVIGGLGLGLGTGIILDACRRMQWLEWMSALFERHDGWTNMKKLLALAGAAYSSFYLLVKWHGIFVHSNYKRFKTLLTIYKLCVGLIFSKPANVDELGPYTRPPPSPPNPFIKKQNHSSNSSESSDVARLNQKSLGTGRLIGPLLEARLEAFASLNAFLRSRRDKDADFLVHRGARMIRNLSGNE